MVQERAVRYWWEVVPELDDFAGNHFRKLVVYERLCFSHLEGRVGDRPGGFNVSGDRRYEKKCMIPLGLLDRVFDDVGESKLIFNTCKILIRFHKHLKLACFQSSHFLRCEIAQRPGSAIRFSVVLKTG